MAPDDPKIDFPHGTILIPAVTPAEELAAAEQRNKRTGAQIIWTRPPAVESAKAAVRGMLPLQWPLTRRMDDWQAAYFAFYELGIALGPISRFKEPPLSSPNGAVKLLYGSVASAVGAFVAGGLTVLPKPGGRRLDEVVTRWRLVTDVTQRACREKSDRHDFWRLAGVTAWCTALLVRGLEQCGRMPEELIHHLVQVAILSTFAAPPPPPPPVTTRTTAAVATAASSTAHASKTSSASAQEPTCRGGVPGTVCTRCSEGLALVKPPLAPVRPPLAPVLEPNAWPVNVNAGPVNVNVWPVFVPPAGAKALAAGKRLRAPQVTPPGTPFDEGYGGDDEGVLMRSRRKRGGSRTSAAAASGAEAARRRILVR
jgi:hypothetical protein